MVIKPTLASLLRTVSDQPGEPMGTLSRQSIAAYIRGVEDLAPTAHDVVAPDALMVFDGVCNFCSAQVRLVVFMDRRALIRFTAVQSPYGRALCERHGIDTTDPSTFLFFDHGRALEASDAMVALLTRLPRPWRWLRYLALIPKPLRDAAYRWTAHNRYRLLGKRATCMVPTPALRARFVDAIPLAD